MKLLFIILCVTWISVTHNSHSESCCDDKLNAGGRCTGSAYCTACTTCNYCAHCNSGGSCGVCSPSSTPVYTAPSYYKFHNRFSVEVQSDSANIRNMNTTSSKILVTVPKGTELNVINHFNREWVKVNYQDPTTNKYIIGYVYYTLVK